MKKIIIGLITILLMLSLVIAAKPNFEEAEVGNGKNTVAIPEKAVKVAPDVFYLGKALDNGKVVEGYAFIDYKKGYGIKCDYDVLCEPGEHPRKCPDCSNGEDPEEPDTSSCYEFLARGAKWRTVEDYIVDPANTRGLDEGFITSNLAADIAKWEAVASFDILGDEIVGTVDGADTVSTDGKNEIYFADIEEEGVIAMAITWGIFGGPPPFRELVEWDQVYDDVDYDWGNCDVLTDCIPAGVNCEVTPWLCKMDFENIATHELGHSVGLADIYPPPPDGDDIVNFQDFAVLAEHWLSDSQ